MKGNYVNVILCIGYFWLIQQIALYSIFVFISHKIFAPPRLLRPGQLPSLLPINYVTGGKISTTPSLSLDNKFK